MDPLTIGIAAVGIGLQAFGGFGASAKAKEASEIQGRIAGFESQVNDQRRTAMELSAQRQTLEMFRTSQRSRAMAINNATNQGASYGNSSGLPGGLAQIQDQTLFNVQGVNQNLQIGENIFALDDKISQQKVALSSVQSDMATDQSLSNLGGSLVKDSSTIGNIAGAAKGSFGNTFNLMTKGPSGYGW